MPGREIGQRFRSAFDSELCGAVNPPTRPAGEAADRRKVYHVARALAVHMGQDRAPDLQQAEENAPRFLVADLLHAAKQAEAGVVGQHVDGAEFLHGFGCDFNSLSLVADIEDGDVELRVMVKFASKLLRLTAHGGNNVVAAGEDGFANFKTEAARGSGNDPCFRLFHKVIEVLIAARNTEMTFEQPTLCLDSRLQNLLSPPTTLGFASRARLARGPNPPDESWQPVRSFGPREPIWLSRRLLW